MTKHTLQLLVYIFSHLMLCISSGMVAYILLDHDADAAGLAFASAVPVMFYPAIGVAGKFTEQTDYQMRMAVMEFRTKAPQNVLSNVITLKDGATTYRMPGATMEEWIAFSKKLQKHNYRMTFRTMGKDDYYKFLPLIERVEILYTYVGKGIQLTDKGIEFIDTLANPSPANKYSQYQAFRRVTHKGNT